MHDDTKIAVEMALGRELYPASLVVSSPAGFAGLIAPAPEACVWVGLVDDRVELKKAVPARVRMARCCASVVRVQRMR